MAEALITKLREPVTVVFEQETHATLPPGAPLGEAYVRPSVELFAGVALVGMAAMLFEITLTRIFAVQMWYHFCYLVVSLALLGLGASGSLLTIIPAARNEQATWSRLAMIATGCGVSIILCVLIASSIRIDTFVLWKSPGNFLRLLLCFGILSVPFLLAGLAVGSSICWRPRKVGAIYFCDLAGSAVGGCIAPWLLSLLRTDTVILLAGLIAVVGGAILALRTSKWRRQLYWVPVEAILLLTMGIHVGRFSLPAFHWKIPFAPGKIFAEQFFPGGKSEATLPSATAQVDVSRPMVSESLVAGDAGALGNQLHEVRGVTQDGTAPTFLLKNAANFKDFQSFADTQAATSFIAGRASGQKAPDVLVIGVGGGGDVAMSLFFGSRNVTAVELNTAMVRMVKHDYADYIGHLFSNPDVRLITEDGRAYLRQSHDKYDVIQLSGVDTYTALSTGAYTLSENYLYTVEAIMDMYSRLKDGGYINYSRLIIANPLDKKPQERETLRLANIAREALMRLGVADPAKNIAVFQGDAWASTILRKGPFPAAESQALRKFAEREKFFGLVFDPLAPNGGQKDNGENRLLGVAAIDLLPAGVTKNRGQIKDLIESSLRASLHGDQEKANGWTHLAALTVSDSPEEQVRIAKDFSARRDAAVEDIKQQLGYRRQMRDHFSQVLTDTGQHRQSFMDTYFYDLRPPSDDSPFFFDYFKLRTAFQSTRTARWRRGSEWLPEFPVGHIVLISSLVAVVVLAGALILLPLLGLSRTGHHPSGKLRYFAYFGCIACGFMFVEISLIQRFTLFLGHPTYALSVVLTSILAFCGLGALVSSRITIGSRSLSRPWMLTMLVTLIVLLVLDRLLLPVILGNLIALGRTYRILITCLVVAPTAFVMGFPFPMGIKQLQMEAPVLIPWAWAINGFLSVFGSIVAVMLAMKVGFSAVLLVGGLIYATGFVALLSSPREYDVAQAESLHPAISAGEVWS